MEFNIKIFYGISSNYTDVTNICLEKLTRNDIITIPMNDNYRASYFGDNFYGILKKIFILDNGVITEYNENFKIEIDIKKNIITTINENDVNETLKNIQSKLSILYGDFNEEIPEQKMVVRYLTGSEKILEIGGNIGRNSLVIASILKDNTNLVTLESDISIASQLKENRDLNNFNFYIENSALSNRCLIQKGWDTIPSETLKEGYNWVNTISLENLKNKYNIEFDTLVLDCEGAFYYILLDMPEILNNIKLIIMENDYYDISKKNYIDEILVKNNFYVDYQESGGWGPCMKNFFEVWKK
jgi:FkbM family methyltransferase